MPKPLPPLETDTVSVPTLPPIEFDSVSPSRETVVEGYNPEEHGELSRDELIELFGEENMAYIFELRSRQAALTVSRPSPDRRETTAITTSARKSKYKSTDIAGARQPSRPKKQTIGVGKRVFVERKHLKYMFDPTSESFAIIEMNSSDKFRFFGSVVGKANKLYRVKLDLLPSSANEVCISRSSIEVLAPGQEEEPYTPRAQAESEMIQECSEVVEGGSGKSTFVEQLYSHFTNLPVENQAIASEFVLKYGQEEESVIRWRILSEEEQITECPMERERSSMAEVQAVHERIPWDPDPCKVDYNRVLLDHFFPSLAGKAKVLDDFLRRQPKNPRVGNPWKVRVERDNIQFHREDADDPDELVSMLFSFNVFYCLCLLNLTLLHTR